MMKFYLVLGGLAGIPVRQLWTSLRDKKMRKKWPMMIINRFYYSFTRRKCSTRNLKLLAEIKPSFKYEIRCAGECATISNQANNRI